MIYAEKQIKVLGLTKCVIENEFGKKMGVEKLGPDKVNMLIDCI